MIPGSIEWLKNMEFKIRYQLLKSIIGTPDYNNKLSMLKEILTKIQYQKNKINSQ